LPRFKSDQKKLLTNSCEVYKSDNEATLGHSLMAAGAVNGETGHKSSGLALPVSNSDLVRVMDFHPNSGGSIGFIKQN